MFHICRYYIYMFSLYVCQARWTQLGDALRLCEEPVSRIPGRCFFTLRLDGNGFLGTPLTGVVLVEASPS